MPVDSFL